MTQVCEFLSVPARRRGEQNGRDSMLGAQAAGDLDHKARLAKAAGTTDQVAGCCAFDVLAPNDEFDDVAHRADGGHDLAPGRSKSESARQLRGGDPPRIPTRPDTYPIRRKRRLHVRHRPFVGTASAIPISVRQLSRLRTKSLNPQHHGSLFRLGIGTSCWSRTSDL